MLIPSLGGVGGEGEGISARMFALFYAHKHARTSGSLDIIRPCLLYRALDKLCRSSRSCESISPQSDRAPPTPPPRCVRTQVWRLNEKGAFVNLPYITHTHFQPRITYMLQGKTFRGPHCDRQHKYAHPIIGELFTPTSPANKGRKRRSRDQGADP